MAGIKLEDTYSVGIDPTSTELKVEYIALAEANRRATELVAERMKAAEKRAVDSVNPVGYHVNDIKKGKIGELSKVAEELSEAQDAEKQECQLMVLVELSDILGAIEAYLEKHHPSITMDDLKKMSDVTRRAFKNGVRK